MPKRITSEWKKVHKPRYTSKAYRAYLEARSLDLGQVMYLEILETASRPGFARLFFQKLNKGPSLPKPPVPPALAAYRALPRARPYDRRIVSWPVEPEWLAFKAKFYVRSSPSSTNRRLLDAAFESKR